jgi:hypothetical protein
VTLWCENIEGGEDATVEAGNVLRRFVTHSASLSLSTATPRRCFLFAVVVITVGFAGCGVVVTGLVVWLEGGRWWRRRWKCGGGGGGGGGLEVVVAMAVVAVAVVVARPHAVNCREQVVAHRSCFGHRQCAATIRY